MAALLVLTTVATYSAYAFYYLRFLRLAVPTLAVLAAGGATTLIERSELVIARALRRQTPLHGLMADSLAVLICFELAANNVRRPRVRLG